MSAPRVAILLGLALSLVAGCAGGPISPEALQAWVGRPAAVLEQEWGPATREVRDGEVRILIYEEMERRSRRDFEAAAASKVNPYSASQLQAHDLYRAPAVHVRSYVFWVNPGGTIVHSAVRHP